MQTEFKRPDHGLTQLKVARREGALNMHTDANANANAGALMDANTLLALHVLYSDCATALDARDLQR